MNTYLVEVIYEKVEVDNNGTPDMQRRIVLDANVQAFQNEDKSVAKTMAQKYFDNVLRYGMKLSAGSIIKAVIPPHCIKNIGIIDLEKYQTEQEEMEKEPEAVIPEFPTSPEE